MHLSGLEVGLATVGLKGREVLNIVTAATALRMELTVLHYDQDFEMIAEVTGLSTQWVVERGTVD